MRAIDPWKQPPSQVAKKDQVMMYLKNLEPPKKSNQNVEFDSQTPTWTVKTHKKTSQDQTKRMVYCTPLSILMTIFEAPKKTKSSNPAGF